MRGGVMSLTQYGIEEESDRLADENGRRVTQKRDAKNTHPDWEEVIVDGGDGIKCVVDASQF
jgi:hypothetical protein